MEKTSDFFQLTHNKPIHHPQAISRRDTSKKQFYTSAEAINASILSVHSLITIFSKENKKVSLFRDNVSKISTSAERIKRKIEEIKHKLKNLEYQLSFSKTGTKQEFKSLQQIISILKRDFLQTSKRFQKAVEIRTRNLAKQRQEDKKRFGSSFATSTEFEFEDPNKASISNLDLIDEQENEMKQGFNASNFQPKQGLHKRSYLRSRRHLEAQQTEHLVNELSQSFSKMATMVHEQGEVITRIDDNLESSYLNIDKGQSELLKYYSTISKERQFIIKFLLVILFIGFIFILIF